MVINHLLTGMILQVGAHHSRRLYIPIIWSPQMGSLQGTKKISHLWKRKIMNRVLRRDMLVPRFGKYSLMTTCLKLGRNITGCWNVSTSICLRSLKQLLRLIIVVRKKTDIWNHKPIVFSFMTGLRIRKRDSTGILHFGDPKKFYCRMLDWYVARFGEHAQAQKKHINWTNTSIGIWVCFKSHWIKTSVDQNENKALGISEVSKKIALGSLWNQHPLRMLCPPDQIAPSLKQVELTSPIEPRNGWSFKHSFERDMEQSLVILRCFLFRFPVSFIKRKSSFLVLICRNYPNSRKKITSSKSNWHVEIGSWSKSNIPNKQHFQLYRSHCWWKKSQTTTWDG